MSENIVHFITNTELLVSIFDEYDPRDLTYKRITRLFRENEKSKKDQNEK